MNSNMSDRDVTLISKGRRLTVGAMALGLMTAATPSRAAAPCAAQDGGSHERAVEPSPAPMPASDEVGYESRLLNNVRQMTFEGRRSGEGYFSPDGKTFAFQSERESGNPFFQIYRLDLENGDTMRISTGAGKTTCAFFRPGSSQILFASTHLDADARAKQKEELDLRAQGKTKRYEWDYDEHFDLFTRDTKTDELTRLTSARGYDAEGSYSPDGKWIVFASNRTAYESPLAPEDRKKFDLDRSLFMDIYLMKSDGAELRRLTTEPGYDGGPFFSPDGRRICWRHFSEDGARAEIFTMNTDGSDVRQLTRLGVMSWAPFYHPSGKYLIFTTNLHGFANFELYLVDVDGAGEPVRVTGADRFDGLPAFSSDGKTLAWTSNRNAENVSQIYFANWDHQEALALLEKAKKESPAPALASMHAPTQEAAQPQPPRAGTQPAICVDDLKMHVSYLASEELEGRLTGTRGEELATAYVADHFKAMGLLPEGNQGDYFYPFEFTAGVSLGKGNEVITRGGEKGTPKTWAVDRDWRPIGFSTNGRFEPAGVVFAGYGLVAPEGDHQAAYDSFVHLDVKDKWALILRYLPEDVPPERRQHLARYASLRYKAMVLRDLGARGMIVASGPRSQVKEELVKLGFDASLAGSSMPAISVTNAVAESLLTSAGKNLAELQKTLDAGETVMGFAIPDVSLTAAVELAKVTRTGRNVLGRLPCGRDRAAPAVMVGAHVDHLGRGEGGGSLARGEQAGGIHYGADDNASGTASIMEIAEHLADLQRKGELKAERDIVFAAWSGEELGLLGSKDYVDALAGNSTDTSALRNKVAAYVNLDMVGRFDKALILDGCGSSSIWRGLVEKRNVAVGLPVTLKDDAYLPTDATSFYLKGVPILAAFTGSHADYHSPTDTPEKLDYERMAKIDDLLSRIVSSLASDKSVPDYLEQAPPQSQQPRAGLRAYLGTIPDYGDAGMPGLKISGVSKGGPAEKAGLKGGDVIVSLSGKKIENIYDYTYAIEAVKIGQETEIEVVRDGQRIKLKITPGSRE